MFVLLFRGFFLMGIISWYSMNVWSFIDKYFRNEYKKYLDEEMTRHPHLRPVTTTTELPPTENEIIEFKLASVDDGNNDDENNHVIIERVLEMEQQACNQQQQDSCQITQESLRMDYDNHHRDSNGQEEEEIINYWRKRGKEKVDNSNNNLNLYCDSAAVEKVNCVDN